MKLNYSRKIIFLALIVLLIVVFILSLAVGSVHIPIHQIWAIILDHADSNETYKIIIKDIRLPRIILSFLVGSALAVSGVVFQGVIRNPMVDPYIIGVSAGAGTAVTLAILFNWSITFLWFDTMPIMAFLGSLLTIFTVYRMARVNKKTPVTTFFTGWCSGWLSVKCSYVFF